MIRRSGPPLYVIERNFTVDDLGLWIMIRLQAHISLMARETPDGPATAVGTAGASDIR